MIYLGFSGGMYEYMLYTEEVASKLSQLSVGASVNLGTCYELSE